MTQFGNSPGFNIAEAKIPFTADLEPMRESMREAERIVEDFTDKLKKRMGESLSEPIREAMEQIKALEERLGAVKAATVEQRPEQGGSGHAKVDETLAKLTELTTIAGRIEDTAEDIRTAIEEMS